MAAEKNEFYDKLHLANAVYCLIFLDSHKGHELIKGPEKPSSHETYESVFPKLTELWHVEALFLF